MSNSKISQLTAATTPVAGTEVLPIVQSGATVQVSINSATGITRPFTANGVVYASSTTALTTGSALVFDGTTLFVNSGGVSVTPAAGTSSLDASPATVTLAISASQTFPSASGMLLVTSLSTGATYLFICGGGATAQVSGVGASIGTFAFNGSSYAFTNTTLISQTYTFMFLKTRNSA